MLLLLLAVGALTNKCNKKNSIIVHKKLGESAGLAKLTIQKFETRCVTQRRRIFCIFSRNVVCTHKIVEQE